LAWLATYSQEAGLTVVNLLEPKLLAGIFVGAMLPFLFSALTMKGVSRGALAVVEEVRRQFIEKTGLMAGTEKPDYCACVDLTTKRALKGMIVPGILVVLTPIVVGLALGKEALAGTLVGALATGFLLALFLANSGAAWDNAKKYIEAGNLGGKGSEAHKAAVVGDTVGDPGKDCSGPSINILIKLMSIVALIIVSLL
ncbi:sodium/proton-translocating pyrophosphatase, partial [Patescibacteria group bacterium]|nr:sodium/proton-translocating pyrophosphatase [Patescibacteria group bacterium]